MGKAWIIFVSERVSFIRTCYLPIGAKTKIAHLQSHQFDRVKLTAAPPA